MHLHEDGGILKNYEKDLKKRKEKEKENQKMTYQPITAAADQSPLERFEYLDNALLQL